MGTEGTRGTEDERFFVENGLVGRRVGVGCTFVFVVELFVCSGDAMVESGEFYNVKSG